MNAGQDPAADAARGTCLSTWGVPTDRLQTLQAIRVDQVHWSTRAHNAIHRRHCTTVADIVAIPKHDWPKFGKVGVVTLTELQLTIQHLANHPPKPPPPRAADPADPVQSAAAYWPNLQRDLGSHPYARIPLAQLASDRGLPLGIRKPLTPADILQHPSPRKAAADLHHVGRKKLSFICNLLWHLWGEIEPNSPASPTPPSPSVLAAHLLRAYGHPPDPIAVIEAAMAHANLFPRQAETLRCHWGLAGSPPMTYKELRYQVKVTPYRAHEHGRSAVRQLHKHPVASQMLRLLFDYRLPGLQDELRLLIAENRSHPIARLHPIDAFLLAVKMCAARTDREKLWLAATQGLPTANLLPVHQAVP